MTAMLGLWVIFMLLLFVLEPLLHGTFERTARRDPTATLRLLSRLHAILLILAAITALGAVAGAHGFAFG
jgi:hypothetical protein